MKKIYQKPVLARRETLQQGNRLNGAVPAM